MSSYILKYNTQHSKCKCFLITTPCIHIPFHTTLKCLKHLTGFLKIFCFTLILTTECLLLHSQYYFICINLNHIQINIASHENESSREQILWLCSESLTFLLKVKHGEKLSGFYVEKRKFIICACSLWINQSWILSRVWL